jgi:hypothetical protein
MTRYQELTTAPTISTKSESFAIRAVAATAVGTILLIGAVAVAASAFAPATPDSDASVQVTGEVTDGWMAGITAANRQRAAAEASRTVDGWAARYLKPEPPVVDGWASALLKPEPEVVDGWMTRYFVADGD